MAEDRGITLTEPAFEKMLDLIPMLVEIVEEDTLTEDIKFSLLEEEEGTLDRPYFSASDVNGKTRFNIGVENFEFDQTFGGLKQIYDGKTIM